MYDSLFAVNSSHLIEYTLVRLVILMDLIDCTDNFRPPVVAKQIIEISD